jgi:hypothetical protein
MYTGKDIFYRRIIQRNGLFYDKVYLSEIITSRTSYYTFINASIITRHLFLYSLYEEEYLSNKYFSKVKGLDKLADIPDCDYVPSLSFM